MPYIVIGALIIGVTLGLMGSGGSILTVPILIYGLGHEGKVAIAESLTIVGVIAVASMVPYARSHQVDWRSVLYFGIPGMVGTYSGAWLSHYVATAVQLILFAVVMLAAAGFMFRGPRLRQEHEPAATDGQSQGKSIWIIALEGFGVGILTGLVGVGGGFLIVPALVLFGGLPMRMAVGTSLAVIAMNSLSGFTKYLDVLQSLGTSIDWVTVLAFIAIGIVGSLAGHRIALAVNQQRLRRVFAVFLLAMGLFVLGKEGSRMLSVAASDRVTAPIAEFQAATESGLPQPISRESSGAMQTTFSIFSPARSKPSQDA